MTTPERSWSLQELADAAVATVAGCTSASVVLIRRGSWSCAAATDLLASALDEAQLAEDSGPTLTSVRAARQVVLHDVVAGPGRYEAFRAAATSAGVTAVIAAPVVASGVLGSLTCYSTSIGDFDDDAVRTACELALEAGRRVRAD